MQPHFFSWLETILKYLNILFTSQPYRHLHPHWGFLSHLPVTCSVKSTLEDNRRCLNQVLFPDTHSRNLIRLDRYSLIVPGRRVPFSSSRSITSPASPTVSSGKIMPALLLLLVTCFLKKKEQKTSLISSLFYIFGVNWISTGCVIYAVRKYFFGFSVSKNPSDIEEKLFKVLYAVPHNMDNILSRIHVCSRSHLICNRSQCNM
jgi:hypothetical protein